MRVWTSSMLRRLDGRAWMALGLLLLAFMPSIFDVRCGEEVVAVAAGIGAVSDQAAEATLERLTPAWDLPNGWAVTSWDADADASRVVFVRGSDRIEHPQPGWRTRDFFVVDEASNVRPIYGPDAGSTGDPISRIHPSMSGGGEAAFFGTYRKAYPQGTDLRRWVEGSGQEVVAGSGKNFDLDFPDIAGDGASGAYVEILPLTADNFVFKMILQAWSEVAGSEMLIEYPNRHVTGLALSGDGTRIAYCLQDFSEDIDRGAIRLRDADGVDRSILTYEGVAGPVAISADGAAVAAFLPNEPDEVTAPSSGVPGVYLWRQTQEPARLDRADGSADRNLPLTMSADGTRVSWGGLVWAEGDGVSEVFEASVGDGSTQARMSSDGLHWTVWLHDGPDGPGLYRLDKTPSPSTAYVPRAVK